MATPDPPAAVDLPVAAAPPAAAPIQTRGDLPVVAEAPHAEHDHGPRRAPRRRPGGAGARRARRRLRRHRHEPALRAARSASTARTASTPTPEQRARRPLAHLLVADLRGHRQVPRPSSCAPTTAARAASWRCMALVSRQDAPTGRGRAVAARARRSSARRCSTATASSRRPSRCSRAVEGLTVATAGARARSSCRSPCVDPRRPLPRPAARHRPASGAVFGPIMLLWFVAIARARRPRHRRATRRCSRRVNPLHARPLLRRRTAGTASSCSARWSSCITGGEALYADMGHFGQRPIRLAWFALGHAGAAAQLLRPGRAAARTSPAARANPFYLLAPGVGALPAGRPRHRGHRHRLAGAHLRRLLADPPGGAARLLPAHHHRAHLAHRDRARSTSPR